MNTESCVDYAVSKAACPLCDGNGPEKGYVVCNECREKYRAGKWIVDTAKLQTDLEQVISQHDRVTEEYFDALRLLVETRRKSSILWERLKRLFSNQIPQEIINCEKLCSTIADRESDLRRQLGKLQAIGTFITEEQKRQAALASKQKAEEALRDETYLEQLIPSRFDFIIPVSSYKHGNRVDNYVRRHQIEQILEVFEHKCVKCGSPENLTLDHFWLPKNDGGNFVMCKKEPRLLMSNVVVLCGTCNSAEGARGMRKWFSPSEMKRAFEYITVYSDILNRRDSPFRRFLLMNYPLRPRNVMRIVRAKSKANHCGRVKSGARAARG